MSDPNTRSCPCGRVTVTEAVLAQAVTCGHCGTTVIVKGNR